MPPPIANGLLVLDKPVGLTSRDVVDRAMRWFPRKTRIGHTGTLDPLASGVLVLCIGPATRLTEYVHDMAKTYVADLVLGARSATDDAEGPITPANVDLPLDRVSIDELLACFLGEIEQIPPAFSAAKVAGRRAYALARVGAAVELPPRIVRVDGIDVLAFEYPRLRIKVRCGKGTYIRALARDLGERLGCGAYLGSLRRTRVGPFTAADAISLEADAPTALAGLLPAAAAVAGLPRITIAPDMASRLRHGQSIASGEPVPVGAVVVFDSAGVLVAITTADDAGLLRPTKVFPA